MDAPPLWRTRFQVPAARVEAVLAALDDDGGSVCAYEEGGDGSGVGAVWWVELIGRSPPDRALLARRLAAIGASLPKGDGLQVAPLRKSDWLVPEGQRFPPFRIGRFWLHGSHVVADPPVATVPIEIDAGLAFGTGEHASTRGCLLALDALARRRRFARVLDLGCGTGVLAIAAARCWPARVIAADNDPTAVAVARATVAANRAAGRVRVVASEGFAHPAIRRGAPFDLILANILAGPLIAMAPDLARRLAPRGAAVLSGLLDRQAAAVVAAYRARGLALRRRIAQGAWVTLVLGHAPARARRRGTRR